MSRSFPTLIHIEELYDAHPALSGARSLSLQLSGARFWPLLLLPGDRSLPGLPRPGSRSCSCCLRDIISTWNTLASVPVLIERAFT